jgi:hypothetical protein
MPRPPEPDAGGRGVRLLRRPENALPLQALGDPAYAIRRDRPTKSPSPSPVRASHRLGAQEASIPIVGGVVVRAHVDPAGVRDDVVDAVGHGPAQLAVGKSWVPTRIGSPLGSHSRPLFLKGPTSSFFVSTLITGAPPSW